MNLPNKNEEKGNVRDEKKKAPENGVAKSSVDPEFSLGTAD